MNLAHPVDQLDQLIEHSIHVPLGGKVLMDEATLREIAEQLRQTMPDEARFKQRMVVERDRILAEARAQARHIVDEAQAQMNDRLEDQSTVQQSRERARLIVAEAEQQARRLRADTNTYVANQLSALESRVQRILHEVQSGQRFLAQPVDGQGGEE